MGLFVKAFRASPANPINWLLYGFGGGQQSYSGVNVTEDNALRYSAVWCAVRFISEITASLPLHLYRKLTRGKERADDHPLFKILHRQPNPEMTAINFRECLTGQAVLRGKAFAEIDRDNSGKIKALWPLITANMHINRDSVTQELTYLYRLPTGTIHPFESNQILRIAGFSEDGLEGFNPCKKLLEPIGLGLALEEYGARFFSSGGKPAIALEHPGSLSVDAQDRLKKSWSTNHEGLTNAHRIAILEEGMKLHEYGVSPQDAQALESRKFQVLEVARIFNIAPHILKDLDRASYNSVEMLSQETVTYTLQPWAIRLEQAYSMQLLNEKEQGTLFFEHMFNGLLRGDIKTRKDFYTAGRQWGYFSANDVREFENMNPVKGGDIYLIPLNMTPADGSVLPNAPAKTPPAPANPPVKASDQNIASENQILTRERILMRLKPIFCDSFQRVLNKETKLLSGTFKRYLSENTLNSEAWLSETLKSMPEYIQSVMKNSVRSLAIIAFETASEEIREECFESDLRAKSDEFTEDYFTLFIERHLGELKFTLKETPVNQIIEKLDSIAIEWTERMVKSEMIYICNTISMHVFCKGGYASELKRDFFVLKRD